MGYVGVTKGGGEEEGREKSILANLDRRLCVIQTKKKRLTCPTPQPSPGHNRVTFPRHAPHPDTIRLFSLIFSLSFRLAGEG